MRRRRVLLALSAAALLSPFHAFGQSQRKVWHVGFLGTVRPETLKTHMFVAGMEKLGYVEGKNLVMHWRFSEGRDERLPALAAELVRANVDAIVTTSTPGSKAAQEATRTIPIIMTNVANPVRSTLVASLARPGANITGLSGVLSDRSGKQVEILLTIVPKLRVIAVLANPGNQSHAMAMDRVRKRAELSGTKVIALQALSVAEIDSEFGRAVREGAGAVIILAYGLFHSEDRRLAELSRKHRLPSIATRREFAESGGLLSYGPAFREQHYRAAGYVDKIFKGAKPAELPVEEPTKPELFINARTAKAFGLAIPQELLRRADKVIE